MFKGSVVGRNQWHSLKEKALWGSCADNAFPLFSTIFLLQDCFKNYPEAKAWTNPLKILHQEARQ